MVAKTDLSNLNCSLARALNAAGDWWTLLIVRDVFLGATRFAEFEKSLGIAKNILSARLGALVNSGILERKGTNARPHYSLTKKGSELAPSLVALMQWGDKWESAGKPPMIVTDENGENILPVFLATRTGRAISAGAIRFKVGPGANARTRAYLLSINRRTS